MNTHLERSVPMKWIFVTGLPRSGGSLCARLFETKNPNYFVYPFEARFWKHNPIGGNTGHQHITNEVYTDCSIKDILRQNSRLELFSNVVNYSYGTHVKCEFDKDTFFSEISKNRSYTRTKDYIEELTRIFSLCWIGGRKEYDTIVWHCHSEIFANLDDFLVIPDVETEVVHTRRDVYGNVASRKKNAPWTDLDALALEWEMDGIIGKWLEIKFFPEKYTKIKFEDMIKDNIGVRPKSGQSVWKGNSWEREFDSVTEEPLRRETELTDEERKRIDTILECEENIVSMMRAWMDLQKKKETARLGIRVWKKLYKLKKRLVRSKEKFKKGITK